MLSSSSLVQFFVSAVRAGDRDRRRVINFNLIARPMAEMVGGTNFIGSWQVADIAALVIILVEVSMGLFLMESLRITRLFPVIGALPDKWRVIMVWITLGLSLTALASVEAGLAYMREVLLHDEVATSALLARRGRRPRRQRVPLDHHGSADGHGLHPAVRADLRRHPARDLRHSLRTVLGVSAVGFLRGLAGGLRLLGAGCRYLGRFLVDVYDIVIFLRWLRGAPVAVKGPKLPANSLT